MKKLREYLRARRQRKAEEAYERQQALRESPNLQRATERAAGSGGAHGNVGGGGGGGTFG